MVSAKADFLLASYEARKSLNRSQRSKFERSVLKSVRALKNHTYNMYILKWPVSRIYTTALRSNFVLCDCDSHWTVDSHAPQQDHDCRGRKGFAANARDDCDDRAHSHAEKIDVQRLNFHRWTGDLILSAGSRADDTLSLERGCTVRETLPKRARTPLTS